MYYVLGGTGFVGQGVVRALDRAGIPNTVVTRANYDSLTDTPCDVFINANGNSKKFMAARDPFWEFDASVRSVVKTLSDFKFRRYVHLSTGDVYPRQDTPDVTLESQSPDPSQMSRYGLHKYMAELAVSSVADNWLIFRMGGFVGPGMKKNSIFDMLNNETVWLHRDSNLQFISTDSAGDMIVELARKDVQNEIVNMGAHGTVRIGDVYDRIGSSSEFADDARQVQFEISTNKLESLIDGTLPDTKSEIETFLSRRTD